MCPANTFSTNHLSQPTINSFSNIRIEHEGIKSNNSWIQIKFGPKEMLNWENNNYFLSAEHEKNIMVKRQRMQIGMKTITKHCEGQLKRSNWNIPVGLVTRFRGLSSPGSMSGLNLSRIVILLLLVPQIAQTKVAKSKGEFHLTTIKAS